MTIDELRRLAQTAITEVELTDTTLTDVRGPDGPYDQTFVWRLNFRGLKADTEAAVSIGVQDAEAPDEVLAKIRHELRTRRCPVCVGRANQEQHHENGQPHASFDVECEECRRPFLITHPAILHFRAIREQNRNDLIERLSQLQRAIRESDRTLTITNENWLGLADAAARRGR
jgi:hypothetical protein